MSDDLDRALVLLEEISSTLARIEAAVAAPPKSLLTRAEAAARLSMSLDHFERWAQPNMRLVRVGRKKLVPVAEVGAWVESQARYAR